MYTIRPSKRKITFKENELIPDHMPQLPLRALFVGSSASGKTQALASMLRDEDFGSKQAWEQWKTGSNGKLGAMENWEQCWGRRLGPAWRSGSVGDTRSSAPACLLPAHQPASISRCFPDSQQYPETSIGPKKWLAASCQRSQSVQHAIELRLWLAQHCRTCRCHTRVIC